MKTEYFSSRLTGDKTQYRSKRAIFKRNEIGTYIIYNWGEILSPPVLLKAKRIKQWKDSTDRIWEPMTEGDVFLEMI